MILAAAAGDLEGAQPVAEAGAVDQRPAALETEEHRAAKGVAATGRNDDFVRRDAGNERLFSQLPDLAALCAELRAKGVTFPVELKRGVSGSLLCYVAAPDGVSIELMQC